MLNFIILYKKEYDLVLDDEIELFSLLMFEFMLWFFQSLKIKFDKIDSIFLFFSIS